MISGLKLLRAFESFFYAFVVCVLAGSFQYILVFTLISRIESPVVFTCHSIPLHLRNITLCVVASLELAFAGEHKGFLEFTSISDFHLISRLRKIFGPYQPKNNQ